MSPARHSAARKPSVIRPMIMAFCMGMVVMLLIFAAWIIFGLWTQVTEQRTALEQIVKYTNEKMEFDKSLPTLLQTQAQQIKDLQDRVQRLQGVVPAPTPAPAKP